MSADERARLEAAVAAAEADIARLRAENADLAAAFRAEPTDNGRELLKRAAASLAAVRDALDAARAALAVFDKTGSPYGLVAEDGKVTGTIGVKVGPGASAKDREDAIERGARGPARRGGAGARGGARGAARAVHEGAARARRGGADGARGGRSGRGGSAGAGGLAGGEEPEGVTPPTPRS